MIIPTTEEIKELTDHVLDAYSQDIALLTLKTIKQMQEDAAENKDSVGFLKHTTSLVAGIFVLGYFNAQKEK